MTWVRTKKIKNKYTLKMIVHNILNSDIILINYYRIMSISIAVCLKTSLYHFYQEIKHIIKKCCYP